MGQTLCIEDCGCDNDIGEVEDVSEAEILASEESSGTRIFRGQWGPKILVLQTFLILIQSID